MNAETNTSTQSTLLNLLKLHAQLVKALQNAFPAVTHGSVTLAAAATTVVPQKAVTATCLIELTPANAAAATLVGSAKCPYVSAQTAGTGFTIALASSTAAGTEIFNYAVTP